MKKVFVIVDKQCTPEQMESIRKVVLDPSKPCIIGSELAIKQIVNIEFDEVAIVNVSVTANDIKAPEYPKDRIG